MEILELDTQLNQLIIARQSKEAFLRFYAEDVIAQENDEPERKGREAWMQARLGMESSVKRFAAKVLANAANGHTSFSEWEYDVGSRGWEPCESRRLPCDDGVTDASFASGFITSNPVRVTLLIAAAARPQPVRNRCYSTAPEPGSSDTRTRTRGACI